MNKKGFYDIVSCHFDTSELRRKIKEKIEDISYDLKHKSVSFKFEEQFKKYNRIKAIKSSTDSVVENLWKNLK